MNAAFAGLYLLKMACLFPGELDLGSIIAQVEQLAQLLSDVSAERRVNVSLTEWSMLMGLPRCLTADIPSRCALCSLFSGARWAVLFPMPCPKAWLGLPRLSIPRRPTPMPFHSRWRSLDTPGRATEGYSIPRPYPFGSRSRSVSILSLGSPERLTEGWLSFQNLADLGLPPNGMDGVFLQLTGANGWTGDYAPIPEVW